VAELLKRTFHVDVFECPKCQGRMRLLAVLTEDHEVRHYLRGIGEAPKAIPGTGIVAGAASVCRSGAKRRATELPTQGSARAPPYWASRALRRREPFASLQLLHYGPSVLLFVSRKVARRPRRRSRVSQSAHRGRENNAPRRTCVRSSKMRISSAQVPATAHRYRHRFRPYVPETRSPSHALADKCPSICLRSLQRNRACFACAWTAMSTRSLHRWQSVRLSPRPRRPCTQQRHVRSVPELCGRSVVHVHHGTVEKQAHAYR
jgi:hypothetical protein